MPPLTRFTGAAKRAAASAALMLVVAGCGTSTDRGQVRDATQRFSDAVAQSKGAVACAQLSPDLRRRQRGAPYDCEEQS